MLRPKPLMNVLIKEEETPSTVLRLGRFSMFLPISSLTSKYARIYIQDCSYR
jgi:hypothetical protein